MKSKVKRCIKCEEGTLGKPKYCCPDSFQKCIHGRRDEHLFHVCNVCKFVLVVPCKDELPKEVYEKFGGKE